MEPGLQRTWPRSISDDDMIELCEMEIRDLLSSYDFPGDDTPITRIAPSIWAAPVIMFLT